MNKNLCFITTSLAQGGLENAVTVMANEMSRKGNQVSIISFYNNPVFYDINPNITLIFPSFKRNEYSTLGYYFRILLYVRSTIKKIQPAVIISYGDYINFISILASTSLKIPIYVSDRSSPSKKFPFYVKILRKLLYYKSTGIIAQTERAKSQKVRMLGEKTPRIEVIPNPIRPFYNNWKVKRKKIILGVGRHSYVKGLDRLINAYAQIENTNWTLQIAGNYGPHTKELNRIINEKGLNDKVELLGPIKDIDKIYSQAQIFVLPSRSEGFPNALIEAMGFGLACISFDVVAGPSDIISNGNNGILVPDGDVIKLKENLILLMDNDEVRKQLSANAVKIKDKLSVSEIGDKFFYFITNNIHK